MLVYLHVWLSRAVLIGPFYRLKDDNGSIFFLLLKTLKMIRIEDWQSKAHLVRNEAPYSPYSWDLQKVKCQRLRIYNLPFLIFCKCSIVNIPDQPALKDGSVHEDYTIICDDNTTMQLQYIRKDRRGGYQHVLEKASSFRLDSKKSQTDKVFLKSKTV